MNVDNLPKISNYFSKSVDDSFSAVVARLTAQDGLPFIKFCTSYDLRKLLHAKGYTNIPKSPNTTFRILEETTSPECLSDSDDDDYVEGLPTKNDATLQKNIKDELLKELSLILDTLTRWRNLLAMLERFYEIRNAIRKILTDIESDIIFDEKDISLLSNIITALQPLKVEEEALCCENVNLFTADITLEFMFNELTQQNTLLSNELKNELILRIKERRTINSDVLHFLHDPNKLNCKNNTHYGIFNRNSEAAIIRTIIELIERVSNKQDENITNDNNNNNSKDDVVEAVQVDIPLNDISLKEKLQ